MFPKKLNRQLIGSVLVLVALTLSACMSSAAPQAGSITTATAPVASSPVNVGSTDMNTATPTASADATGLNTPATPTPQPPRRVVPSVPSAPAAFQGKDCGSIEMVSSSLIDNPTNAAAIDCFWQAYQQCPAVGAAKLFVDQRFFETSNNRIFRLDGTSGSCVLTEELQAFGLMADTPRTSMFPCSSLTRDSAGLHFLSCGSDGDFTIPATPISAVPASPSALSVPTVRTVTLADDGQTITLPTGTSFLLSLGSGFDWQVQIADQTIVSMYANASVPPDAQGIFTATHQGQTTFTATGNPKCYTATPRCLAPSRGFRIQVVPT